MKMDLPGAAPVDEVALRGNRRDSMFLKASIRVVRLDTRFDIVVRNVSAGGMLADSKVDFVVGDAVEVELRNIGTVPGAIAWVRPGRFGVSFDVTVNPQLVRTPVTVKPRKPAVAPKSPPVIVRPRKFRP